MNDNPYSPPTARVSDIEAPTSLERPVIVTRAVYLLWASWVLILPSTIYDVFIPELSMSLTGQLLLAAFILGMSGAVAYWLNGAAWKGKGYARWILAGFTLAGFMLIYWFLLADVVNDFLAWPWYIQGIDLLSYAAEIVGIVLLFAPSANAWYREMRARR